MPAADEREVAFTHSRRAVVLLDGAGHRKWEVERIGVRDVAPALVDGFVLAATDDGIVAFDRSSGSVRWVSEWGERANSPVVAASKAVATTWEGSLTAVDVATGRVEWRTPLPGGALGPAAVDAVGATTVATWENDDGTRAGAIAVDSESGAWRWEHSLEGGGVSAPTVTPAGTAVMVAGDLAAHGLDLATGQKRWTTEVDGAGSPEVPPLAQDDNTVVVGHRLGGLSLLDAATGSVKWSAASDGAAVRGAPAGPARPEPRFALPLDDGRVLVASAGGEHVLAFTSPVTGLAMGPGGALLVATGGGKANSLTAWHRW